MTTSAPAGLLVAELAAAAGVGPDTIRYYERAGLLEPPPRTSGGYRRFPPETIDRLRFIQGCPRLGLRLRDIGDLLSIRDNEVCPCDPAETVPPLRDQPLWSPWADVFRFGTYLWLGCVPFPLGAVRRRA